MNTTRLVGTKSKHVFSLSCLGTFVAFIVTLTAALPTFGLAADKGGDKCLTREGRISVIGVEITALYQRKLFVTKDDLARYVFLTNANYDGDSSVALYRAPGKQGSLRGNYWVTATGVSTSLVACISAAREKRSSIDPPSLKVQRADAPIPASTAQIVHELWLTMLERSRINERAVPCAPTAIISATTARGLRLKAVTVSLGEDSPCLDLMRLGGDLINYPQLSESKRLKAAHEIEKESQRLLKRVSKKR